MQGEQGKVGPHVVLPPDTRPTLAASIERDDPLLSKIHNAGALELYAIERTLVSALVARLERRLAFSLSVADRELYLSIGQEQLAGRVHTLRRDE